MTVLFGPDDVDLHDEEGLHVMVFPGRTLRGLADYGARLRDHLEAHAERLDTLFEQCGAETYRCALCGALDSAEDHTMPSMMGGGFDYAASCQACGASESANPLTGGVTIRAGVR